MVHSLEFDRSQWNFEVFWLLVDVSILTYTTVGCSQYLKNIFHAVEAEADQYWEPSWKYFFSFSHFSFVWCVAGVEGRGGRLSSYNYAPAFNKCIFCLCQTTYTLYTTYINRSKYFNLQHVLLLNYYYLYRKFYEQCILHVVPSAV